MILDNYSLFTANAVILFVMAVAFLLAASERTREPYWLSWAAANSVLGAAVVGYMSIDLLPGILRAMLPNGLLLVGFGLRWRAAREFGGRMAPLAVVLGPAGLFLLLCLVPPIVASYGVVFTVTNALLAAQAMAAAYEFFRDRRDGLPSRLGLVIVYTVMASSFCARIVQGTITGPQMQAYLPLDAMLTAHLLVALFFAVASGSFALSIGYERNARHLKAVAMHDSLTGLLNRRAFDAQLRALLANPLCGGFAVMIFDIDHFKLVNDRYGHAAGDVALRACARICRALVPECGLIARVGGEEFAAILRHVTPEEAMAVADRIREAVKATPLSVGAARFRLTISAGMCHSSTGIADFDELMRRADAGLYAAKHKGRDRVERIGDDPFRALVADDAQGNPFAPEGRDASPVAPAIRLRAG